MTQASLLAAPTRLHQLPPKPNPPPVASDEQHSVSNELIITAAGAVDRHDSVRALVNSAPEITGWQIIAFKPASGFDFVHRDGTIKIDPRELWFLPLVANSDPSNLGLRVRVPSFGSATALVGYLAVRELSDSGTKAW